MNILRWLFGLLLVVSVSLGLCLGGLVLTESGQEEMATRWRSFQNREALRVRARRDLEALGRKPRRLWTAEDRAKDAVARQALRDMGESP